jgi:hypothetical protein
MTEPMPGRSDHTTPVPHYAYPGPPTPSSVPGEVTLADEPQSPPAGGRRRTGLLVGGVVTALVLGGAGAFAFQTLSGAGSQPADVLPGDAFGYLRVDIDPSAGQKVSAVRFLGKLKDVRNTLGSDDPRRKLWEMVGKDSGNACLAKVSYEQDIAPWLGDRAGAAIRPGGTAEKPNIAMAIQVKDEGSARDALTRIMACDKGDAGDVRLKDGYAIVTAKGSGDATLAAAARGTLAQNATYSQDMKALGEQGVVSAWFDMGVGAKEIQKLGGISGMPGTTAPATKGRVAAALRFEADYVELAGALRGFDAKTAARGDGTELATLPANTMAALHVSGAGAMIDAGWPAFEKQLDGLTGDGRTDVLGEVEQQLDVKLPDDLKALMGRSFTVAVPDQDLKGGHVVAGAKIVSSQAKRADEVVDHFAQMGPSGGDALTHRLEGDRLYVATTPDYADDLKAGGRLGDTDTFKAAVGDVTHSSGVLFLDLDRLEKTYLGELKGEQRAVVETMRAVGFNTISTGNGEGTFTLRVLAD